MRFGDPRLGASTTYSGRQITTHMINTISKLLSNNENYPKLVKTIHRIAKRKRDGTVEVKIENEYTLKAEPGLGPLYSDTDSVAYDSIVELNGVKSTIENHFNKLQTNNYVEVNDNGRELMLIDSVNTPTFTESGITNLPIKGLYRHKAKKQMYKICTADGTHVVVTEDHSIMVMTSNGLVEKKPTDLTIGDTVISLK